jgi:hypothetical protein
MNTEINTELAKACKHKYKAIWRRYVLYKKDSYAVLPNEIGNHTMLPFICLPRGSSKWVAAFWRNRDTK